MTGRIVNVTESAIAREIDRLQGEGEVNIWIEGWNEAGTHCLIVQPNDRSPDGGTVTIASRHACNGIGRWECSVNHWRAHTDLYRETFSRPHA